MVCGRLELEKILDWAVKSENKLTEAEEQKCMGHPYAIVAVKASRQMYLLLSRFMGPKMDAKKKKKNAGAQRGLELWRSLGEEFGSHTKIVVHAKTIIFNNAVRVSKIEDLSTALEAWEAFEQECEALDPDLRMCEFVKALILMTLMMDRCVPKSSYGSRSNSAMDWSTRSPTARAFAMKANVDAS